MTDPAKIDELVYAARLAAAAYAGSTDELHTLLRELSLTPDAVHRHEPEFNVSSALPAHLVAVDHSTRRVLLIVRGMWSLLEVSVLVAAAPRAFRGGTVHRGMMISGEALWARTRSDLARLLQQHPDYDLLCVGHSMGCVGAMLCALYAREQLASLGRAAHTRAICFATPAFASPVAAQAFAPFCETVVAGEDFVPRIHFLALERLRAQQAIAPHTPGWTLAARLYRRNAPSHTSQQISTSKSEAEQPLELGATALPTLGNQTSDGALAAISAELQRGGGRTRGLPVPRWPMRPTTSSTWAHRSHPRRQRPVGMQARISSPSKTDLGAAATTIASGLPSKAVSWLQDEQTNMHRLSRLYDVATELRRAAGVLTSEGLGIGTELDGDDVGGAGSIPSRTGYAGIAGESGATGAGGVMMNSSSSSLSSSSVHGATASSGTSSWSELLAANPVIDAEFPLHSAHAGSSSGGVGGSSAGDDESRRRRVGRDATSRLLSQLAEAETLLTAISADARVGRAISTATKGAAARHQRARLRQRVVELGRSQEPAPASPWDGPSEDPASLATMTMIRDPRGGGTSDWGDTDMTSSVSEASWDWGSWGFSSSASPDPSPSSMAMFSMRSEGEPTTLVNVLQATSQQSERGRSRRRIQPRAATRPSPSLRDTEGSSEVHSALDSSQGPSTATVAQPPSSSASTTLQASWFGPLFTAQDQPVPIARPAGPIVASHVDSDVFSSILVARHGAAEHTHRQHRPTMAKHASSPAGEDLDAWRGTAASAPVRRQRATARTDPRDAEAMRLVQDPSCMAPMQYYPAGRLFFLRPERWRKASPLQSLAVSARLQADPPSRSMPQHVDLQRASSSDLMRLRETDAELPHAQFVPAAASVVQAWQPARLVELVADVESTIEPGEQFCVDNPGARWPHGPFGPHAAALDWYMGDLCLTDSMLQDHLVSCILSELESLRR